MSSYRLAFRIASITGVVQMRRQKNLTEMTVFHILKELENGQQHIEGECEFSEGEKIHVVKGLTV